MSEPKKRLPVLQSKGGEPEEEPRPPWHWVGFGAAATIAIWVPLLYAAEAIKARMLVGWIGEVQTEAETAEAIARLPENDRLKLWAIVLGVPIVPFLLGAFFGGFLVGRWGGPGTGVRQAMLGGALAAVVVALLTTCSMRQVSWVQLVVVAVTAAMATVGGRVGLARRARAGK